MEAFPIRVQLLGITNDAAGTKMAKYELLNSGQDRWILGLPVDVEHPEPFYWSDNSKDAIAVLKTGEPLELSIPVERNASRWRVRFSFVDNEGKLRPIITEYFPPNTNGSLTVEQATSTAKQLANAKATTQFQFPPSVKVPPATFVTGHWLWVATQGYGHGDIQAKVELAADGSTNSVKLELLDSQINIP